MAMTGTLLAVLHDKPLHRTAAARRTVTVWLAPHDPAGAASPHVEPRAGQRPTGRSGSTRPVPTARAEPAGTRTRASAPAPPDGAPVPVAELPRGTPPLSLDFHGAAAAAEKRPLRSMAEKAGASLGVERLTEQGRLARSVTRAAKTDCLAPNEHGSLLSIFRIAYEAATDRCR